MKKPQRRRTHSPLPRALFVDEAADRARSCGSKDPFETEAHARAVALMNGMAETLSIYECRYCGFWHFTRRRDS